MMLSAMRRRAGSFARATAVRFKNASTVIPDDTCAKPLVGNDAGAPMRQPVLFVSPTMLLDLNKELVKATVGSVNYGILPRDRNVGGVDIDTIVTPFGSIGLALSDFLPAGTISGSKQSFIVDLSFVKPIFLNIPGYGTMFVRDLDQADNARIAKAVYMEMAMDFGPQQYHCQIDNVIG